MDAIGTFLEAFIIVFLFVDLLHHRALGLLVRIDVASLVWHTQLFIVVCCRRDDLAKVCRLPVLLLLIERAVLRGAHLGVITLILS